MSHPLGYKKPDPLRTDKDLEIINEVSASLVEVGKDDDVERLVALINSDESEDKLHKACEISIAWMKLAQDLKHDLESQRMAGYL